MKTSRILNLFSAATLTVCFIPASSRAASATWSATPTNGFWEATSGETNWTTGEATFPGALDALTNADVATFLTSSATTVAINSSGVGNSSPLGIRGMTFGVNLNTPSAFTIGSAGANAGNSLLLGHSGNITFVSGSTGTVTQIINAPLVLQPASASTAGTYQFINSSAATNALEINGNISGGTTTLGIALTLSGTNTNAGNVLSGVISNGAAAGNVSLSKANSGTWSITGTNNSFAGGVLVNQGTLNVATISNAGINSSIGTGQINFNGSSGGAGRLRVTGAGGATDRTVTIVNNGVNGGVLESSGSGAIHFTGPITTTNAAPSANLNLAGGSALTNTISGNITNSPDTTKVMNVAKNNAVAVWVLSGTGNTYTGTTTVSGGILAGIGANAFGNTSGISIAGAGTLSLRGDANTSFVKASDSSSYAVTTTASAATINVDQATGAGTGAKTMTIGTIATTSVAAAYTLNFTGSNNTSLSVGAMTGSASGSAATNSIANAIAGGGSLTLASYTSANTVGGDTLSFTGIGNTTVTGAVTPSISATTLNLRQNGSGIVTLRGTSSYTGTTTVNTGTLAVASTASLGNTPVSVKNNGTLTGTGSIAGSVTVESGGHLAFTVASNPLSQDPLNITGLLDVQSGSIIDISAAGTPAVGNYTLAVSSVPISYSPSTENFGGITGTISLSPDQLSLVLNVTGGSASAYNTWANTTHGLSGANAAFDFDFDNDGLDNGMEWILGGIPTSGTTSVSPSATRDNSNNLILTFTREEDAIGETVLTLEYGSDLTNWTPFVIDADGGTDANGVTVAINQTASPDAVTVTIPVSQSVAGKIFSRLKAVKIP